MTREQAEKLLQLHELASRNHPGEWRAETLHDGDTWFVEAGPSDDKRDCFDVLDYITMEACQFIAECHRLVPDLIQALMKRPDEPEVEVVRVDDMSLEWVKENYGEEFRDVWPDLMNAYTAGFEAAKRGKS